MLRTLSAVFRLQGEERARDPRAQQFLGYNGKENGNYYLGFRVWGMIPLK